MPLELQIIRFGEFVKMDADGHLDLAASREILRQLAGACRKRGVHQALLDLREVRPSATPMLTPDDLASLVNTFHEVGFSQEQRLAVLYASDPHFGARLFALIGNLRGWNVKATDSFEDALLWLAQTPGATEARPADEEQVPLHFAQPADGAPAQIQISGPSDKAEPA
jgi:hypothetical protein